MPSEKSTRKTIQSVIKSSRYRIPRCFCNHPQVPHLNGCECDVLCLLSLEETCLLAKTSITVPIVVGHVQKRFNVNRDLNEWDSLRICQTICTAVINSSIVIVDGRDHNFPESGILSSMPHSFAGSSIPASAFDAQVCWIRHTANGYTRCLISGSLSSHHEIAHDL